MKLDTEIGCRSDRRWRIFEDALYTGHFSLSMKQDSLERTGEASDGGAEAVNSFQWLYNSVPEFSAGSCCPYRNATQTAPGGCDFLSLEPN